VVHAIHQNEVFYAWQKGGAFLNEKPIRVGGQAKLLDALIGTGFPYHKEMRMETPYKILRQLLGHCRGVRRLGSAAMDLVYTACDRLDGYYESNLNSWDVAAGALIVKEAGGKVTDFSGGEDWLTGHNILAANSAIHNELFKTINSV
ncbi:MAG: inositol monophosphatase, partial [Saprospiraceae bacterium]|nr:inositol monophosphatase [Saprospiraceae bacterium]